MRFVSHIALCGLLLLTGCSWFEHKPKITPETRAAQDSAGIAYITCLRTQARNTDDHTSPVASVAAGAVKACDQQYRAFINLSEKTMPEGDVQEYEAMMNNPNHPLGIAIDAVQYERQAQMHTPAPPSPQP